MFHCQNNHQPHRRSHCPNTMMWRPNFTLPRPFSSTSIWRLSLKILKFGILYSTRKTFGNKRYIWDTVDKNNSTTMKQRPNWTPKVKKTQAYNYTWVVLISTWIRRTKPWSSLSREGTVFVLVLFPEEPVAKLLDWLVAEEVGFLDLLIFAHATISRHCQLLRKKSENNIGYPEESSQQFRASGVMLTDDPDIWQHAKLAFCVPRKWWAYSCL